MTEVTTDPARFAIMREAMVQSQLRPNAVADTRVVSAMLRVPRERFVPEAVRLLSYRDTPVPIAHQRATNTPVATGRLLTEAHIEREDRVLLIGAAGGYTAALLGILAGSVVAVESDPALAALAREALAGDRAVTLVEAPLEAGWPEGAPYDVLAIDGAVEHIPDTLVAQVRPGGRVVTGIIDRGVTRLASGTRTMSGFGLSTFADIECVPLPGFARPKAFTF